MCAGVFAFFVFPLTTIFTSAQTPPKAIKAFNEGCDSYQKGELDSAIASFTRALEISSYPGLATSKQSEALSRANRGSAAWSASDKITIIDPFVARVYSGRGVARYPKGDLDGALIDFERAIRISPRFAGAYLNRGCAKHAKGDARGAIADWDHAIKLDPELDAAYCNRGGARLELGDVVGAFKDLEMAIKLNPRDPTAYCHAHRAVHPSDILNISH